MMLLTEEQAREKSCPYVRAGRGEQHGGASSCMGPDCMAWRWLEWEPGEQIREPGGGSYTTETPFKERKGWCGAFGEPT